MLCNQYQKEEIEFTNRASWLHENGNLEKFIKFISNSNQLKKVNISHCEINGSMVVQILESLNASVATIEKLQLRGVDWDTDDSVIALTNFIAKAPKLKYCSI